MIPNRRNEARRLRLASSTSQFGLSAKNVWQEGGLWKTSDCIWVYLRNKDYYIRSAYPAIGRLKYITAIPSRNIHIGGGL